MCLSVETNVGVRNTRMSIGSQGSSTAVPCRTAGSVFRSLEELCNDFKSRQHQKERSDEPVHRFRPIGELRVNFWNELLRRKGFIDQHSDDARLSKPAATVVTQFGAAAPALIPLTESNVAAPQHGENKPGFRSIEELELEFKNRQHEEARTYSRKDLLLAVNRLTACGTRDSESLASLKDADVDQCYVMCVPRSCCMAVQAASSGAAKP